MLQNEGKYDENQYLSPCHSYKERNSFAFWTVMILLFSLALGNLCLTLTIIGVLKMGKGMENMELISNVDTVKFFGNVDFDRIFKKDGILEGFHDEPVEITGDSGPVSIQLVNRNGHAHNKIYMARNGTHLRGINQFEVKDSTTGEQIFSTQRPRYNLPQGVNNLKTNLINTGRITSPINDTLRFQTRNKFTLRGTEGTKFESKEILWSADQNIFLKSDNGSIIITGNEGVYIDVNNLPIVQTEHGIRAGSVQYKLCVCMPQGKLFRVPVPRAHSIKGSCAHFSSRNDPCA